MKNTGMILLRGAVAISVLTLATTSLLTAQSKQALIGTWRLVSVSSTNDKGNVNNAIYGLHPAGLITYTADGRMSAIITYDGRKALSVNDRLAAPVEERAAAFSTMVAYAGTYTFTGEKVTHHIEINAMQSDVGSDYVRSVTFQGDHLILKTPPVMRGGELLTLELVWERLK